MKNAVSDMRQGFRDAHGQMAVTLRADHKKFITTMTAGVTGMLNGFHKDRLNMAKSSKAERNRFVSHLEASVSGLRQEVADDLAGARRAWREMPSARKTVEEEVKRKGREQAEARAKTEAELRAKEHAEHKARVAADMEPKRKTEKDKPEHTRV